MARPGLLFLLLVCWLCPAAQGELAAGSGNEIIQALFADMADEGIWRVEGMDGTLLSATPAQLVESSTSDGVARFVWGGLGWDSAPNLRIQTQASLSRKGDAITLRIQLTGLGGTPLRAVHFPCITHLPSCEKEFAAVPYWMGAVTDDPGKTFHSADGSAIRREWEYPGLLSMQCLAWYTGQGSGVLLSTRDSTYQRKQFALFGDGNGGVGMEVVHIPSVDATASDRYEPPYDIELEAFNGDWFTAAQLYKDWAQNQPWSMNSRLKRGKTPDWVRNTGIWVWNRGRSPGVLPPAELLQEESGLPVSVFWHWWHGCAYDVGFPEYLPPREGEAPFQEAVAKAKQVGIHALVYMNQRLWGMTAPSWSAEEAARFAVKNPDGSITPEIYNVFMKVPCASMCMGTSFWRNKYAGLAVKAFGLGVGGIYMDQACSSLSCYDPAHGHPPGGGTYWMEGFRTLEGMIREGCGGESSVTLAGEGCGEAWLPHLDLMLSLQVSRERYYPADGWAPIPFFHAVYHDHVVLYGNYSSLTHPPYDDLWPEEYAPKQPLELLDGKFSKQFRMEQARSFVWGQQPTLANFTPNLLEERRAEMEFFIDLARTRAKAKEFLQEGEMLHPPTMDSSTEIIPLSRLSIYAGQLDRVKETEGMVELIYGAAWRSPDGRTGIALANIDEASRRVNFILQRDRYPIGESGRIQRITSEGVTAMGEYREGSVVVAVDLAPVSTCVVEIIPAH